MKNLKFIITFLLLLVLGVGESWGQNVTVILQVKAVLDGEILEEGDPRNPDLVITDLTTGNVYTQCPLEVVNDAGSTDKNKTYKFPYTLELKSRDDYSFKGWATSATSTSLNSDNPYSISANSSYGSLTTTKRYYVHLHSEETVEPNGTDGIAFNRVAGNLFASGSSSSDWSIQVYFNENLTYDSNVPYSGANKEMKSWISVKNKNTNANAGFNEIYTTSAGYAIMKFPSTMPVGKYNVHLPYNLFTTTSGKPTAACDFEIEVTGDDSPFVLNSVTPADGSTWEAEHKDEDVGTIVMPLSITFEFSKILASINTAGKDLSIVHTETGATIPCQSSNIQYTNKNIASLSYGHVRNGHYTLNLPAGVFLDASGNSNDAMTITFTVTKSDLETFALPTFEKATNNLVNGTSKQPYAANTYTFEIKFASNTYGEPLAKWNSENISVNRVVEERVGSTDITAPKDYPISGCTSTFENGVIKVTFPTTGLAEEEYIKIVIPEGYVINKSGVTSATSLESLYKDGACTNPATTISFTAKRVQKGDVNVDGNIDVADVTELVDMILDKKSKNQVANTNGDNNVDVSDVTELVNIILSK